MFDSAASKSVLFFILLSLSCGSSAKFEHNAAEREQKVFENFTVYFQFLDSVFSELKNAENISKDCRNDTKILLDKANAGDSAALKIIDASGKPSSGILEGGVSFIGYYSECVKAALVVEDHHLKGKYCLINFHFPSDAEEKIIPDVSWQVLTESQRSPSIGLCIPAACSENDVKSAINTSLERYFESTNTTLACHTDENKFSKDVGAKVMLAIILIFVILAVVASVADVILQVRQRRHANNINSRSTSQEALCANVQNKSRGCLMDALLAFSLVTNSSKLFSITAGGGISCLNGLRTLSMSLIILGHTFSFGTQNLFLRNPGAASQAPKDFLSQFFANGTLAVDTFYVISGLLVCYITLKTLEKTDGRLNLAYFYIHRIFRLTPLLAIISFGSGWLLPYAGAGPNWKSATDTYGEWCRENSWVNVLYLHNFIRTEHMCLGHSWYLATDMQFYLVVPLILYPLHKNKKYGFASMAVFLLITVLTTYILTVEYHYPAIPYINNAVPLDLMNAYFKNIYIKPYCRMGPYIVGIAVGYLLLKKKELNLSKGIAPALWVCSIAMGLTVIYLMWPANQGHLPTNIEAGAYSALARTFWGISLSWLIIACHYGYGDIVNNILSWDTWIPLCRLTYSAYLIHPIIMNAFYGSTETVFDFSLSFMIYLFLGNFCLTYLLSIPMTLLFESPFIGLEKAILKRGANFH